MSKPYTIIQCSNYFEYMNFKDNFNVSSLTIEYNNSTYTFKLYVHPRNTLKSLFFKYAPTANITQVSFRNGRAIYTKLKAWHVNPTSHW